MTRTFLALELPDAVKAVLRRRIERLAHALPDVRFVDIAGLHLTLAFLGELDETELAAATGAAEEAASAHAPFALRLILGRAYRIARKRVCSGWD